MEASVGITSLDGNSGMLRWVAVTRGQANAQRAWMTLKRSVTFPSACFYSRIFHFCVQQPARRALASAFEAGATGSTLTHTEAPCRFSPAPPPQWPHCLP